MLYQQSGVDLRGAQEFVQALKPLAKQTYNPQVLQGVGGFFGAYALPTSLKEPVLIACTDGVGSKLLLASQVQKLGQIGLDLVAMNVNDLLCSFAKPLFFLDYYATPKLNQKQALEILEGIVRGCKLAGCALLGGESAQMKGFYTRGAFDLAGFCVGVVERRHLPQIEQIKAGDILVGFKSSGLHSNGFSLVRHLLKTQKNPSLLGNQSLLETLLTPTRLYGHLLNLRSKIRALAHITGGGLVYNLPRILPASLGAVIELKHLPRMPIFEWLKSLVPLEECLQVFNMGVGMVAVVAPSDFNALRAAGGFYLGEVVLSSKKIQFIGGDHGI
ncbi:phosphoribosylformylglycinamidine cyclo-ligase [Helicobacter suis]|uniref:phosphoribosylformylglycinamidine cyclo-ligase n=1 Tax=Helicobacter suis TaxID=104628 RepID=UPI0013D5CCD3|nr:phosphoribosylformylglycinamidine cyclo-ligase [Helicobacter suis]